MKLRAFAATLAVLTFAMGTTALAAGSMKHHGLMHKM